MRGDGLDLVACEITELGVPAGYDHAVTETRKWIGFRRQHVKGDDLSVLPQDSAWYLEPSRQRVTHDAVCAHGDNLTTALRDIPARSPR